SHTDKIVGVISEPQNLFSKLVFFPTKATDWILPLLALIIVGIFSTFIYMSNPDIKYEMQQQQQKAMREQFDKMVESGQMTREQADEQLDKTMAMFSNNTMMQLFSAIGIFVMMLLWFFVCTTIAFLVAKFALKGDGTYSHAMTAMGLPLYISVLQGIILVIAGLLMGKVLTGINPAVLLDMDVKTVPGFLLSRLDVFSIWFYAVIGIAFAKMFKSNDVKKYVITSLAVWLVFMSIIFGLSKAVPSVFGNMIR
ncbi:MAG: YIP1 family protein, partial [Ignavibacteriaceae bacterium]|nr:YIP1 family protein [Ignavibacteriaceae bacterium]